jgi:hypothetical protein
LKKGSLEQLGEKNQLFERFFNGAENTVSQSDITPAEPEDETSPVEIAFTNELSEDIKSCLDDNYFLADALFYSFQKLINQTIEQVTIKDVTARRRKKRGQR